jgi:hypothetical protein
LARLTQLTYLRFSDDDLNSLQVRHDVELSISPGNALSRLAPLTGLCELDFGRCELANPASAAPLTALTALTALTLLLASGRIPLPPLPPALQTLDLTVPVHDRHLNGSREPAGSSAHAVWLTLSCRGYRAAVATTAVATSLRTLRLTMNVLSARGEPTKLDEMGYELSYPRDFIVRFVLTPDSLPCAFPALELVTFSLLDYGEGFRRHSASLVPLFQAAPRLRHVCLDVFDTVSLRTIEWLDCNRPGRRIEEGWIDLPPPAP